MGKGWLVAGILAVGAIYAAGYVRTQPAAGAFEERSAERRRPALAVRASVPPASPLPAPPVSAAPLAVPPPVRVARVKVLRPEDPVPAPWETEEPEPKALPMLAPPAPAVAATAVAPPMPTPGPPPPPPTVPAKPAAVWKDGTYQGWGHSRHGDIQASVLIENGRIVSSKIAQCLTRYSCDVIDTLIPQPPQRQSAEVDAVGGATQSSDAFYYAVSEALAKAK